MPNPVRGEVGFDVGGQPRTLRLDFNAMCSAAASMDCPVMALGEQLAGSFRALRAVFAAALGVPELVAGRLVDDLGLTRAGALVGQALKAGGWSGEDEPAGSSSGGGWDWPELLATWVEAGQDEARFWAQTPRTCRTVLEGASRAEQREQQARGWLAYHAGLIGRQKKPPSLEEMMGIKRQPPPAQTREQMAAAMLAFVQAAGGRVIH